MLPGDTVTPRPCAAVDPVPDVTLEGPSGPLDPIAGSTADFRLRESGPHEARLSFGSGCVYRASFDVGLPQRVPDSGGVSSGELRDLAARVGAAFVAGQGGAYGVSAAEWSDLSALSAGGAPRDMRAVAVHDDEPIFGPDLDDGAVYRFVTDDALSSVAVGRLALPAGSRAVRALAARLDREGPVAVATSGGLVVVRDVAGRPSAEVLAADLDVGAEGYAAIGATEPATRGAVWLGWADRLVDQALAGGSAFAGSTPVATPGWMGGTHAVEVDDRDPAAPRLWLCGDMGVALYDLSGDWSAMSALPEPVATWSGSCLDLAVGDDGHAWVAAGADGLSRLDESAAEVTTYGEPEGLGSVSVERVATAWDDAHRQVWLLDVEAREVLLLGADPLP